MATEGAENTELGRMERGAILWPLRAFLVLKFTSSQVGKWARKFKVYGAQLPEEVDSRRLSGSARVMEIAL